MIRRFNRLIFLLLVVAVSIYLTLLNQELVTFRLLPDSPINAQLGIVIICTFAIGMFVMSVIALWFGLQSYIRERAVYSREKERQLFYQSVLKARSHQSAEEWEKAKNIWEQSIRKDPTHIISRVELSKAIQTTSPKNQTELLEALKVLDAARAQDPKNTEVLFRAAEINIALNNKTSALDNLALIIYETPVKRALIMARDISEDLGRYQDALEYHKKLEAIGYEDQAALARLKLKQLVNENANNKAKLLEELKNFAKRNPAYAPAHETLADSELQIGKVEEAAQSYVRAVKLNFNKKTWQKAARIWIKNHAPEKALSAARAISNESKGEGKIDAEIELIRLYIALNMLEEAKKHCDLFTNLAKQESVALSKDKMREFLALKGLCHARLGDTKTVTESLKKICEDEFYLDTYISNDDGTGREDDAPAPRLSTP
jgi:tetratricopeptide (TPR) repeat protein